MIYSNDAELLAVHAELAWQRNRIDVRFGFKAIGSGVFNEAQPIVFKVVEPNIVYGPPALSLTKTDAQQLMDELWRCGVRPTEAAGSAGSMAAQTRHLEDMRAIAFGVLGDEVTKP